MRTLWILLLSATAVLGDEAELARATADLRAGRLEDARTRLSPVASDSSATTGVRIGALQSLALLEQIEGHPAAAEASFREALALTLPDSAPRAECLNGLAAVLLARGETEEAERLASEARRVFKRAFGRETVESIAALNTLADARLRRGDAEEAESLLRRADRLAALEKASSTVRAGIALRRGLLWLRMGLYAEAENVLERSLELAEEDLAADHPVLAHVRQALSRCYRLRNRPLEAARLEQDAGAGPYRMQTE